VSFPEPDGGTTSIGCTTEADGQALLDAAGAT
jgi:hypothetical protein